MILKSKYPTGIQTFSEIRDEEYLYVDKTALIYALINSKKYVFLSRPRRFGKSLLVSTLEAFFNGERKLFKGLAIDSLEKEWKSYPVLRFDLSGISYENQEDIIEKIGLYLDRWESEYEIESKGRISTRFSRLIYTIFKNTGKKVVILIDEYDKPLLDSINDTALYDSNRKELNGFYGVLKECDAYIKFGMITGITKFAKVNIFSGLNNLRDISLLPEYNGICGITESEFRQYFQDSIGAFAKQSQSSEEKTWGEFKRMYDGYRFASEGENIYNPYSILSAFDDHRLGDYWFDSGSSSYLISIIKKSWMPVNELEGAKRKARYLSDIIDMQCDIVPVLYQAGYLTIKDYNPIDQTYTLGFPNDEVNHAFWQSLADYFFHVGPDDFEFTISEFVKDVNEGRTEEFMTRLKALIADTYPGVERNKEVHFQNVMSIIFKMLGFSVQTEVGSSAGRCDLLVQTSSYVYIFEFKLDGSADKALAQILEKGYYRPFLTEKRTLFLIGAVFSSQTNTLMNWEILDTSIDSLPLDQ